MFDYRNYTLKLRYFTSEIKTNEFIARRYPTVRVSHRRLYMNWWPVRAFIDSHPKQNTQHSDTDRAGGTEKKSRKKSEENIKVCLISLKFTVFASLLCVPLFRCVYIFGLSYACSFLCFSWYCVCLWFTDGDRNGA